MTDRAGCHWLQMVTGLGVLILIMQAVGLSHAFGPLWPVPTDIAMQFVRASPRAVLLHNARISTLEMLQGLAIGLLAGSLLAFVARVLPALSGSLNHFAVIVQAVPIVAIAPVLLTTVPRGLIPATLASIGSFFASFIAFSAGLSAVRPNYHDLFRVLGAGRIRYFWYLGLPTALPLLITGISYAIPGAVAGAVIGEWFGASQGLGIVLLQTMRSGDTQIMLAAATLILAITLAGYGLTFALGRWTYGRVQ